MGKESELVVSKVRGFGQRKRAIVDNRDLSKQGMDSAIKRLEAEQAQYRATALLMLGGAWRSLRRSYAEIAERRSKAERLEAERWDYKALDYHAQAAKNAIKSAFDFDSVSKLYSQAASSGDINKARAWAETTQSVLSERFGASKQIEAGRLSRQMSEDLTKLLDTPELAAVRKAEDLTINKSLELRDATLEASKFYSEPGAAIWGEPDDFILLMDGVEIEQRFDSDRFGFVTSLSIDEPEPAIA